MQWLIDLIIERMTDIIVPPGTIVVWSGLEADIADGWHICDGTHGTPDYRDKFVAGASKEVLGEPRRWWISTWYHEGGADAHDHGGYVTANVDTLEAGDEVQEGSGLNDTTGGLNHEITGSPNVPAFVAAWYIMKLYPE